MPRAVIKRHFARTFHRPVKSERNEHAADRRVGPESLYVAAGQDEVIAFLSNGASYGLPGADVERLETHCSLVFLVCDRAYKLKRSVAFSMLDYSSVELREAACHAELRVNRRTAPELYLGVQPIRRQPDGRLAFDGEGPAADWIVVMRRFDQSDLFDHLADAGRLTPELIAVLAGEIARFHETAELADGFGGCQGVRAAIERNCLDQKTVEAILGSESVAALYRASLGALGRLARLLDRRRCEGRVRRCHGDVRLANICLLDGRPTLFDGVEFCNQISHIDVLFDLAFPLMDLHHRGLDTLANILFNRYADISGDTAGLAALPLMQSVHAARRAYAQAGAAQRHRAEAQHHLALAKSHMALASSLLSVAPGRLIAVGGLDSSLKTSVVHGIGAVFQPVPGARVLHGETIRRRIVKAAPHARLTASAYDEATSTEVHAVLAADAGQALEAGLAVIVDAGFMHPGERQEIAGVAAGASVPFTGIWLGPPRYIRAAHTLDAAGWHVIPGELGNETILATARRIAQGDIAARAGLSDQA